MGRAGLPPTHEGRSCREVHPGLPLIMKGSANMLVLAHRYREQLNEKLQEIAFDDHFKFLNPNDRAYFFEKLDEDSENRLQFVSVHNGEIIGYLTASINRQINAVSSLSAVNFTGRPNKEFSFDFARFFIDLFEKFNFSKINFGVVVGNPAEKLYDQFIANHGGRVAGLYLQDVRCWDGNIYDWKVYEVLRSEFRLRGNDRK
jgi:hypothetical protein